METAVDLRKKEQPKLSSYYYLFETVFLLKRSTRPSA